MRRILRTPTTSSISATPDHRFVLFANERAAELNGAPCQLT
jgi:hypothetical protein